MILKQADYQRIYQIVSAVAESENQDKARSCIYYSLFSANILSEHFNYDAKVKCGLAVYHLGDDDQVLCFGEMISDRITATRNAFHCWVDVRDWYLDFMAPNFGTIKRTNFTIKPKMFQKKHSDMVGHPNNMTKAGEFFFAHNQALAEDVLAPICEKNVTVDLASICTQWFKKVPKKNSVFRGKHRSKRQSAADKIKPHLS